MLTVERLRVVLDYDPNTGLFWWKARGKGRNFDNPAGWHRERGYRCIEIDWEQYRAHRLAWLFVHGEWPPDQIDHINGVKDDNRIANLRAANNSQNQINTPGRSASGCRGVCKSGQKWSAAISVIGKMKWLGTFDTKEEAAAAYGAAAENLHGEFVHRQANLMDGSGLDQSPAAGSLLPGITCGEA